uniref:Coiled-coil domain-containing protein 102A n=1 Tax=Timema douglasi TaxID=61478 RepID=A0A7R8Z4J8_TIMDO|nr:unnamed protein product [Timema douglasi]
MAQGSSSGTTSRRHGRSEHDASSISSTRYADTEWETKEALRQRELEEARARATQMEKTMRWWSDCTANWREKWSKVSTKIKNNRISSNTLVHSVACMPTELRVLGSISSMAETFIIGEMWVRNERNKAREESKMLRTKLEMAVKETNSFKREKLELETQNDQLKKEMEKIHLLLLKHAGQWDQHFLEALGEDNLERDAGASVPKSPLGENGHSPLHHTSSLGATTELAVNSVSADLYGLNEATPGEIDIDLNDRDSCIEEYVLQGAVPKHAVELYDVGKDNATDQGRCENEVNVNGDDDILTLYEEVSQSLNKSEQFQDVQIKMNNTVLALERRFHQQTDVDLPSPDQEHLLQKLSMLQLRLDEASKTIQAERDGGCTCPSDFARGASAAQGYCSHIGCTWPSEKASLHRSLEKVELELQEWRERCEDLRASKQEVSRELLQLQDQHQDQVRLIQLDLQDEASSREGMDRRLADLRSEVGNSRFRQPATLERLQAENASEWGKRERLETEKLALERDNKKLRSEVRDLQERLERKGRPLSTSDADVRQLQQELVDKNKELSDLKHSHGKLKKVLQDKSTELAHAVRRADQYESEVKRLRGRVEELKKDLAVAEDEVDSASNNIRLRTSSCSTLLSRVPVRLGGEASDDDINDY